MHAETVVQRFWSNVDVGAVGECWLWKLHTGGRYGRLMVKRKNLLAHRVAWEIANGPIPDGAYICHSCDVPACCNPAHLWIGDPASNAADRNEKGRQAKGRKLGRPAFGDNNGSRRHPERLARGDRNGARLHPERLARGDRNGARLHPERLARGDNHVARRIPGFRAGERNGRSVLTMQDVERLRERAKDEPNKTKLAKEFGIGRSQVGRILSGEAWAK